jgi:hypothetical protein
MSDAVTYWIEAAVGAACVIASVGAWRRRGLRLVSAILAVAGVAAVTHATVSLTSAIA